MVEPGLLRSASLCGTCHEVTGPGVFQEPTTTEFRAASQDDAACASCHFEGHAFRGLPRLAEALRLEVSRAGDVTLTNGGV